jgi:hypothetical protein
MAGRAPYGYRYADGIWVLKPEAAAVVRAFFDHFLLYGSLGGAMRHVNRQWAATFAVSTGRRWLTHPCYRHGQSPLLRPDEAAQVDRWLRRNRTFAPRAVSAPRALSGLVRCAHCAQTFRVASAPPRYLYLRPCQCPRSPKCAALDYTATLNAIIDRIALDLPQRLARTDPAALGTLRSRLEATIAQKQQVLSQIPLLLTQDIFDRDTADQRQERLRQELAALMAQRDALPPVNLGAIARNLAIPAFWHDLSEPERRSYLREFLRGITLDPRQMPQSMQLHFFF